MKTSELIFIGIKGRVVALSKATGQQVWATKVKGIGFVNVALEDDKILALDSGEIYCLDALTGRLVWHNPLKGYGTGLATLATARNIGSVTPILAEKRRRDEEAAAATHVTSG